MARPRGLSGVSLVSLVSVVTASLASWIVELVSESQFAAQVSAADVDELREEIRELSGRLPEARRALPAE